MSDISDAMSLLFVPATRPERLAKALASGAHGVILNLEDSVAPEQKAAARDQLLSTLLAVPQPQRARVLVRCNARGTPWHAEDLEAARACVESGMAGAMLAKSDAAAALKEAAAVLGPRAAPFSLVESLRGLDALDEIARAPQVLRLAFGHLDFQHEIGMNCADDKAELVSIRLAFVLASRRAELPAPVDGSMA